MNFDSDVSPGEFWSRCFSKYSDPPETLYTLKTSALLSWNDVANSITSYAVNSSSFNFRTNFPDVPLEFVFDKLTEVFYEQKESGFSGYYLHLLAKDVVSFVVAMRMNTRVIEAAQLVLSSDDAQEAPQYSKDLLKKLSINFPKELPKELLLELESGVIL